MSNEPQTNAPKTSVDSEAVGLAAFRLGLSEEETWIALCGVQLLVRVAGRVAQARGWRDVERDDDRQRAELVANLHGEVSELWEVHRRGETEKPCEKLTAQTPLQGRAPTLQEEELADICIRIMDYCAHKGLDLASAILLKCIYNASRPYRHGGKRA